MRLIDAHQIESILTYTEFDRDEKAPWLENEVEAYRHFLDIIQSAHTAYDVDKVLARLDELRDEILTNTAYDNDTINHYLGYADLMIEAVKAEKKE